MPAFQQVHEELGPRVRLIGINPLDGAEQAQDFADEVGVTYELLRDPDGRATAGLGVARFPTTVFVAADGTVLDAEPGSSARMSCAPASRSSTAGDRRRLRPRLLSGVVASQPLRRAMLPAYLSYFLGLENQSPADELAQAGVAWRSWSACRSRPASSPCSPSSAS